MMTQAMTLDPILDIFGTTKSYSQKVADIFWDNTNTVVSQTKQQAKLIDKKLDFLAYNLEQMMDLPKIENFNRTQATKVALSLDRIRETFGALEKKELKELLHILNEIK